MAIGDNKITYKYKQSKNKKYVKNVILLDNLDFLTFIWQKTVVLYCGENLVEQIICYNVILTKYFFFEKR